MDIGEGYTGVSEGLEKSVGVEGLEGKGGGCEEKRVGGRIECRINNGEYGGVESGEGWLGEVREG